MILKRIIRSPEQENAYQHFMLKAEVIALRWTCVIGLTYMLMMLVVDYWRVDSFFNVFLFRGIMAVMLAGVIIMTNRASFTLATFYTISVTTVTLIVVFTYSMDYTTGLPAYYVPNAVCLYFYTYNAALGYPLRIRGAQTIGYLVLYFLYSVYLSPHQAFHVSQSWNLIINASISTLVGFLTERYKRINFVQREELLSARNRIGELNNLKTKLISVLSHDLSSPINNLKLLLEWKEQNQLSDQDMDQYAVKVKKSLENASSMLQNLVRWSRLQMEGSAPERQPVNTSQLITEVISSVDHLAQAKAIAIDCRLNDPIQLSLDAEVLKLVTRNLLTNAIKFSHEQSSVEITSTKNGEAYCLTIRDSGVGIPPEVVENLFTLKNSSRRGTKQEVGTGIGLLLTKEFLTMMRGTISVQSDVGKGSIFTVTLPLIS